MQLLVQEDDYGRARVHTQWGNDEELIEEAVQMCPVDCIAYVSLFSCSQSPMHDFHGSGVADRCLNVGLLDK